MSKAVTIILIILLTIITFGLAIGLYLVLDKKIDLNNFNFNFSSVSTTLVDEKEIYNIKDLNIKTDVTDIDILENDSNSIKVELYSDYPKNYEITENANNIKVVLEEEKRINIFSFKKTPKVKIYVPKSYDRNIVINSNIGDVKIGYLEGATLDAKLDIGDLKVKQIKNASIDLRVGDVKIEKINSLTTEVKTGDIKIQNINEIIAKTTTGDIKINNLIGSIDITSNAGDVKIENAIINKNSKINSKIGDVKIGHISGCYIDAKTNVGDTKVENKDRKSNIELKITNNIGDIKVY